MPDIGIMGQDVWEGSRMKTLLQYPGGKRRLAPWIVGHMPAHHSYLEPFFGGGAVLFEKPPARIETVNDLDGDVVNFFRVIRDMESRKQLQDILAYTPYARQVFEESSYETENPVERAVRFAIRSMQSHGFRTNGAGGWKKDVYGREYAYAVRYWNELPGKIAEMAIRLKYVQIECRPALELIRAFNHPNVLIYCDPPYLLSTRGRQQYRHEMTEADHKELLKALCESKAMVMLSGYESDLYDVHLKGWRKEKVAARTQSGKCRTETLWINFEGAQNGRTM